MAVSEEYQRRFAKHIEVQASGCWHWVGAHDRKGYGCAKDPRGEWDRAHRIAVELRDGDPAPAGKLVLHTCDNPQCVNPEHLRIGTHRENMADRSNRGRTARGERCPHAKLDTAKVREIRRLRRAGATCSSLAAQYGVSVTTVIRVTARRAWSHVGDD